MNELIVKKEIRMFDLKKYGEQRIDKIVIYPIVCEEEEK